ncbi:MAG TPA: dihydroorotate dehydrogenase [Acidimicrobiales bacterium]
MSEVDLTTALGDVTLANPVMVAAGCGGSGRELDPFVDLARLGALVTRSVTLDPRAGGPPPRAVETPSGILSDTGLQGAGLQGFLATELPWLAQRQVRTVVSIAGQNLGEWAELARRVGLSPGVTAVEVNLAWPPGAVAARDSYQAGKILAAVRRDMPRGIPVLAKLAPDVHHVVDVARAVVKAGADAVVVGHGLPGLALDPLTLRPSLGNGTGSLSGPAVHAVAMRCLWEVHSALPEVALVGSGGVRNGLDALAMLAAGARAVQVGTTVLHDPGAPDRIVAELHHELDRRGIPSVADVVGHAHRTEGDPR